MTQHPIGFAAENIPAGVTVELAADGRVRIAKPPSNSTRELLDSELAEAYRGLEVLDQTLADLQLARDTANERIIAIEAAIAHLARLEARPKTLTDVAAEEDREGTR